MLHTDAQPQGKPMHCTLTPDQHAMLQAAIDGTGLKTRPVPYLTKQQRDELRAMVDDGFHMDAWQEVERAFRIAMQKSYEKMIKESREHAEHNARMTVLKAQAVAAQKQTIIPFCHNTPGNKALAPAMPQAIYDKAMGMGKSSILSIGTRISATGATVPNRNYKWDKAGDEFSRGKRNISAAGRYLLALRQSGQATRQTFTPACGGWKPRPERASHPHT